MASPSNKRMRKVDSWTSFRKTVAALFAHRGGPVESLHEADSCYYTACISLEGEETRSPWPAVAGHTCEPNSPRLSTLGGACSLFCPHMCGTRWMGMGDGSSSFVSSLRLFQ